MNPSDESLSVGSEINGSTLITALIVFGLAALIVCAEAEWRHQGPARGNALWTHRAVMHRDLDATDERRIVHQEAGDRADAFALEAGDDCLYMDDSTWTWHEPDTGDVLVPVFCPAHGAGWASLAFLEKNRAPFAPVSR